MDFIYFIIYSVIGWCCEVAYCSTLARKFINRGFLSGPLCPIYGFGALIVVTVLSPYKFNVFLVFVLGMLFTSTLEYITSFLMEKIFHSSWWDYSDKKFNINGRVCLINSIMFGVLSVFVVVFLDDYVVNLIDTIPYSWIQAFAIIIIMIFSVDLTITVQAVIDLNEKMHRLREITFEIKDKFDEKQLFMEQKISDRVDMLKNNLEKLEMGKELYAKIERPLKEFNQTVKSNKFFQRRLIRAFPKMKSVKFQEQLQNIKNALDERKNKSSNN
ncbi:hypothetical protein JYG23_09415 [Sedimentibacter sp. zth1]|uniref:putative ABC transporter permease n=1 Tax=Sedimentibacter sp. zth1 TaxID=2816908 RepID=UPI001A91D3E6|nr:hypothetical protein [Sedimentibacter sp. zth1]QSX04909.1 hypothetical protein JYG23_09415 [Sedimentibacter sp. zth1]